MQNISQTNPLPDLSQVPLFSVSDEKCLADVAEVLKKHRCLDRFGVNLLHQHFSVGDDEVMLETNNPDDRTLRMRPVKVAEIEATHARITSWRLDTGKPQMACICIQAPNGHEHHSRG